MAQLVQSPSEKSHFGLSLGGVELGVSTSRAEAVDTGGMEVLPRQLHEGISGLHGTVSRIVSAGLALA